MTTFLILIAAYICWKFWSTFNELLIIKTTKNKIIGEYKKNLLIKTLNIIAIVIISMVTTTLIGVDYSQVSIFISSIFAVIGMALFAQWSILSNITSSFIIFFSFPYKVGDEIKILDKDGDISGVIKEITLFNVLIQKEENLITYPNNLILQKAVVTKRKDS